MPSAPQRKTRPAAIEGVERGLVKPEVIAVARWVSAPKLLTGRSIETLNGLFFTQAMKQYQLAFRHNRPAEALPNRSLPDNRGARFREGSCEVIGGILAVPRRSQKLRPVLRLCNWSWPEQRKKKNDSEYQGAQSLL
jgi:hypothetical protein